MKLVILFVLFISIPFISYSQSSRAKKYELKRLQLENIYTQVGQFDTIAGIATCYKDQKMGYVDTSGVEILPLGSHPTNGFSDSIGIYFDNTQKVYVALNKKGVVLKTFKNLSDLSQFKNGVAICSSTTANLYGVIDFNEQVIIPFRYASIKKYSSQYYLVANKNYGHGIINTSGDTIVPLRYNIIDYIDTLQQTFIGYREEVGYAIFDFKGTVKKYLGQMLYTESVYIEGQHYFERNQTVIVKDQFEDSNCRYALVNLSFDTIIPMGKYYNLSSTNEGLIKFSEDINIEKLSKGAVKYQYVKSGFIDTNGNVIIPAIYDYARYFSEGLCAVQLNNKWGYIDKNGVVVIPIYFENAHPFNNGYAKVEINNTFYVIDKTGKKVLSTK